MSLGANDQLPRPADVGDSAELRKARGAFFTPPELCRYMVDWAVRSPSDEVLEPSCGEAAFLLAAASRLAALGPGPGRLRGVELHPASARRARRLLAGTGHDVEVVACDFFALRPQAAYDAVVGNPPYVRYQDFAGEARARAREAALRAGVNLTNLASSWAAFTVHAALFVRPTGRLALVLPAELLSVNYAAGVRQYLMNRFARVRLVLFSERIFPGVLEEVVLLLAEGAGPTDHCELVQVRHIGDLLAAVGSVSTWQPTPRDGKWTQAMLPPGALQTYTGALARQGVSTLHDWGETTLGAVTGSNRFFTLSPEQVGRLGLDVERDLVRISPPGSRHLRRVAFNVRDWRQLGEAGQATWLLRPAADPSAAARDYLSTGEQTGVPSAYKCRVRDPWWRVPLVPPADLLLTYMNADTPRLASNRAGVHHLNSVHGVYLRPGLRRLGGEALPLASLNTLTLLGAEIVGRAYGGGLLKLEPREADGLPVPAPGTVDAARAALRALRAQVITALDAGRLLDAVDLVDRVLLTGELGMTAEELSVLRDARATLAARRAARAGGRHAGPPGGGARA